MSDHAPRDASVTVLEFAVTDRSYPMVAATAGGGYAVLEELVPRGGGDYAEFFSLEGCAPEAVVETADGHPTIDAEPVADGVVEVVVDGSCPIVNLAETGALPRTVEVADGRARLIAEVPSGTDPTAVADRFTTRHPDASLQAKAQQPYEAPMFSTSELEAAVADALTDRQLEVLEAAHAAGYYEWPRETTAEDLAADLGVTPPTLHGHLRAAERKLLTLILPAGPVGGLGVGSFHG